MVANVSHDPDLAGVPAPASPPDDVPTPGGRRAEDRPATAPDQPDPPGQPDSPDRPDRLRDRTVLVVGTDGGNSGPAVASPVAMLARRLAGRAAAVTLLTGVPRRHDGRPDRRYRFGLTFRESPFGAAELQVTRWRHHVPRGRTGAGPLLDDLTFVARSMTSRLATRPDLVVAVTPGPGGAVAGARIAARRQVPLLVVVHDLLGGDPGRTARRLARLERSALRRATRVAVPSGAHRTAVQAYGVPEDRITVLPEATAPGPAVDRLTARRRLGWRPGTFLVVVPDPLSPGQGLDTLLAAGRHLGSRAELVLLARGGEAGPLAEHVSGRPRVHVVDTNDGPTRAVALAAADVLVVGEDPPPPVGGGSPGSPPAAILECFRAGRPVIATVAGGGPCGREITLSRGAGIVVRPGDPALLAAAVTELRADDALRTAMGAAGRLHAHQRLDRDAAHVALDALVEALCPDAPTDRP